MRWMILISVSLDLDMIPLLCIRDRVCIQLKFSRHWCLTRHFSIAGKSRTFLILLVHMLVVKCLVRVACVIFEVSVSFQSSDMLCGGLWSGSVKVASRSWSVKQLLELDVFSEGCAQVRNFSIFVVITLIQMSRSSCNVLGSSMSSLGTRGLRLVSSSLTIISLFVSM